MSTESRNKNTMHIDKESTENILRIFNEEDKKVPEAIEEVLPQLSSIVDQVVKSFNENGRLFYVGAGTSGRLGVLDAVECVPTFGTDAEMVQGLIAGGDRAIKYAVEGAEDSEELGKKDLIQHALSSKDIVISVAASGKTPYCIGAIKYANEVGANTVSISCNKNAILSNYAQISVEVDCGPEVITGSTRLKAGSAQKMMLNMISSTAMIKLGKVYENLMVDVKPTNEKLKDRAIRIIMEATDCKRNEAENYFELSEKQPKVAIMMILTHSDKDDAENLLRANKGFIKV